MLNRCRLESVARREHLVERRSFPETCKANAGGFTAPDIKGGPL